MFLTIDPGADMGWSLWDGGRLADCGLGDPRTSHYGHPNLYSCVWIESQVIYPRSKARPADILKLAQAAGRWAGIYSALGVPARWVEPAQWKGQIPKPKRGETYIIEKRVLEVLSPPERAVLDLGCKGLCASKRHNVIDAVGIGLWVRKNGKS